MVHVQMPHRRKLEKLEGADHRPKPTRWLDCLRDLAKRRALIFTSFATEEEAFGIIGAKEPKFDPLDWIK